MVSGISSPCPLQARTASIRTSKNDLAIGGIHLGGSIRLSVGKNSAVTLPSEGDFSDVSSSLSYTLEEAAPSSAVARIDYTYGDRNVGHAYLEAVNVPAYTPDPSMLAELAESTGPVNETAKADSGLETGETEQADPPESSRADEDGSGVQEKDEKPETAGSKAPEKRTALLWFPSSLRGSLSWL